MIDAGCGVHVGADDAGDLLDGLAGQKVGGDEALDLLGLHLRLAEVVERDEVMRFSAAEARFQPDRGNGYRQDELSARGEGGIIRGGTCDGTAGARRGS